MRRLILLVFFTQILTISLLASNNNRLRRDTSAFIDKKGVVRFGKDKEELKVFGVNYNVPFSYLRFRELVEEDQYKAIDEDVYHIARMGVDGFRVHVWDCYISDEKGNLLDNEFLKLYDYLHYKLVERGIKLYITPMNLFTDNGKGFVSHFEGKNKCLSNPEAFPVLANYLKEFVNHVNPYTGVAYKNDPNIVAFELVNEPSHWAAPELVTDFVDMMYSAVRETGCNKPLFYNLTTCSKFIDSVFKAGIDGGSFQWYPTGLTSNFDLKGNFLPYVDNYYIPFDEELKKRKLPKFIYEFSPADVGKSAALYPAMARSFREAGFQFVAKFTYDPLHSAYSNIEFKTHFLNTIYTPEKAMGMMIASEVFHEMPMYKSYGRFPENNSFGSCVLDDYGQSAEFMTRKKFLYTSTTETTPKDANSLEKIAGVGSSPIVDYSGTGVFIMDKLESGVWRLEVFPDAFWVNDPFSTPTLEKEVAVTVSRSQGIKISLADLGSEFNVEGLNSGNSVNQLADGGSFSVEPGVYLLTRKGVKSKWNSDSCFKNIRLGEYYTTRREHNQTYVINSTANEITVGEPNKVSVKIISKERPQMVTLQIFTPKKGLKNLEMKRIDEYNYEVELPEDIINSEKVVDYNIKVRESDGLYSVFPRENANKSVNPVNVYSDDLRQSNEAYKLSVVSKSQPVYLFSVNSDYDKIIRKHRTDKLYFTPAQAYGGRCLNLSSKSKEGDNIISVYCRERVSDRLGDLSEDMNIEVFAKSLDETENKLKVNLIMRDGTAFGAEVKIGTELKTYKLALSEIREVVYQLNPLPYPLFNMPESGSLQGKEFNISEIEKIQLGIQNIAGEERQISIEWIRLSR